MIVITSSVLPIWHSKELVERSAWVVGSSIRAVVVPSSICSLTSQESFILLLGPSPHLILGHLMNVLQNMDDLIDVSRVDRCRHVVYM